MLSIMTECVCVFGNTKHTSFWRSDYICQTASYLRQLLFCWWQPFMPNVTRNGPSWWFFTNNCCFYYISTCYLSETVQLHQESQYKNKHRYGLTLRQSNLVLLLHVFLCCGGWKRNLCDLWGRKSGWRCRKWDLLLLDISSQGDETKLRVSWRMVN